MTTQPPLPNIPSLSNALETVIANTRNQRYQENAAAELAELRAQRDDLLAALQMAVLYLEHPEVEAIPFAKRASTAADQLRAAIARATGQDGKQ